jgi:hypothetical protein
LINGAKVPLRHGHTNTVTGDSLIHLTHGWKLLSADLPIQGQAATPTQPFVHLLTISEPHDPETAWKQTPEFDLKGGSQALWRGMRHKSLRNDVGKDYIHGSSNVAVLRKGSRGFCVGTVMDLFLITIQVWLRYTVFGHCSTTSLN